MVWVLIISLFVRIDKFSRYTFTCRLFFFSTAVFFKLIKKHQNVRSPNNAYPSPHNISSRKYMWHVLFLPAHICLNVAMISLLNILSKSHFLYDQSHNPYRDIDESYRAPASLPTTRTPTQRPQESPHWKLLQDVMAHSRSRPLQQVASFTREVVLTPSSSLLV